MTTRNLMAVMLSVILLIGALVGYGIYVNISSSAHVDKLAAAQYSRVSGAKAAYREIVPVLEVSALYLQSSWMLDVHAKLDGTLTRLHVNPGDQVRAGQLLAEIANDELPSQILQAEGKINEAQANLIKHNNTLNRYKALVNAGGISKQQVDEAIANQAAGTAMLMTAEASRDQLASRLTGQKIFAPRDGDILKVYAKDGAFIRTGSALVMIGDFSVLLARENLRQEILEKLLPLNSQFKLVLPENQPISKAYAANYRKEDLSGERSFGIRLEQVNPPLEIPARYRSVVWQVENPGGILEPGTYYRAQIHGTTPRRVLAIPLKAVNGKNDTRIFLVAPDHHLVERQIRTGVQDEEFIEVLEGLQEGDVVVLTGREGLAPGSRVQTILDARQENR